MFPRLWGQAVHRNILADAANFRCAAAYCTGTSLRSDDAAPPNSRRYDLTTYRLPYTPEDQSYLLHTLKNISTPELSTLRISKRIIKQLEQSQEDVESYQSLSEILAMDGLGIKAVEKLCDTLLLARDQEPSLSSSSSSDNLNEAIVSQIFRKQLVKPRLSAERLKSVESVVSLYVTAGCLAWTHMDRTGRVLDLSAEELLNSKSRFTTAKIYDKVMDVASRVPPADLYVWEDRTNHAGLTKASLGMIIISLQLAQIKGMLTVILETRTRGRSWREEEEEAEDEGGGGLVYMKDSIVPKLFKLEVEHNNKERAPVITLADKLLKGQKVVEWLPVVSVGAAERERYFTTDISLRRHLAAAVFVGMAFQQTVMEQNLLALWKLR